MNRKIISFMLCGLFLSTVTILPTVTTKAFTWQNHTQLGPTIKQINPSLPPEKAYIKEIYEQTVKKITLGLNPSDELSILLSNPHIQNIIKNFSDEQTLEIMNTLFSNKPIFTKLHAIRAYEKKMNLMRENESVQLFEQMFKQLIDTNLTPDVATFLPEEMLTKENKSILFSLWNNYLNTHPNIAYLLDSTDFNPFGFAIFFIFMTLIWGFVLGGLMATNFEALLIGGMYTEAAIIGIIGGSFLGDIPFSGDFPIIQKFIRSICNSTGLSQSIIENMVACTICLIIVAAWCYFWTVPITKLFIVKTIGGAAIVIGPPLIFGIIGAYFQPTTTESLLIKYY